MQAAKTILVVEDTVRLREILRDLLKQDGFEVRECGDSQEALDAAEECDFHAAIVDYRMPGLSGADVTRRLRPRFPAAIIIGVSFDDRGNDFLEAGADGFLMKPYEYDELLDFVNGKR